MKRRMTSVVLKPTLLAASVLLLIGASYRNAQAYPAWGPDTDYSAGTIVTYNGQNYQAILNQTDYSSSGWNPTMSSLWTPVGASSSGGGTSTTSPPTSTGLSGSCPANWCASTAYTEV
ncbi:carbohydrate-binding protein [Paraburkholderia caffeinilytica]|uniref:carbohydrate-binding protein n=1 Tax=Paraburkholderia caffeinilytica TaxID=1761016 RepID=UPI003D9FBF1E